METYQYGTTVRLSCTFSNFDNEKVDPDLVKVIIYDKQYKALKTIIITPENRLNVGEYFYDYTTEAQTQVVYYEWYGEIAGKPTLKRGYITTKFI